MNDDEQKSVEVAEISSIMQTRSGRNVMMRILEMTGLEHPTFNPDPITHAYNAGARERVGIPLRNYIRDSAPGEYMQMLKENS